MPVPVRGQAPGLECQRLSKKYFARGQMVSALEDVSLCVYPHEFLCIVGPSGCGKTTLLKMIAGLIRPTSGSILFHREATDGRPVNAMVFQEHGLFPWKTILDNVAFGLEMQGVGKQERRARAMPFIDTVGLGAFANSFPHELSVGMRQRAGIVRAFLTDPDILLMDEPFGSLDAQTKLLLEQELLKIWHGHQRMVIYVTHDIQEAVLMADRVAVMSGRPGRIREEIAIPLARPRDPLREEPEAEEIKWHIWEILKDEAQRSLSLPQAG